MAAAGAGAAAGRAGAGTAGAAGTAAPDPAPWAGPGPALGPALGPAVGAADDAAAVNGSGTIDEPPPPSASLAEPAAAGKVAAESRCAWFQTNTRQWRNQSERTSGRGCSACVRTFEVVRGGPCTLDVRLPLAVAVVERLLAKVRRQPTSVIALHHCRVRSSFAQTQMSAFHRAPPLSDRSGVDNVRMRLAAVSGKLYEPSARKERATTQSGTNDATKKLRLDGA